VFPKPDRPNSALTKNAVSLAISSLISLDLCLPKGVVDGGNVAAFRATMPEATIKKNGNRTVREIDVGFPLDELGIQDPSPDTCPHQHGTKPSFGRSVAPTSDGGHAT
jgi:hypothetical protein